LLEHSFAYASTSVLEKRASARYPQLARLTVSPWPAAAAALLVAFDAAVRFDACRLLGEPTPTDRPDPIQTALRSFLPERLASAAIVLAAAWRAALLSVANGVTSAAARAALEFALMGDGD
jgi:hypothetical protein